MSAVVRLTDFRRRAPYLHFTRAELNRLLGLYASRVSRGEWRDYAIHHGPEAASFMVFASSNEQPLFTVSKLAKTKNADRRYVVLSRGAVKLKQSADLAEALEVFDRPIKLVSG
ncbi:MAG: DUF2794 domain-containing protein [Rhodospirillaceae bacterium]|nr:DUF2794 domain-containing protein [Rhodospirillaceae bacterium]